MVKKISLVIIILSCVLCFTSCIPGDGSYIDTPAGFLSGIWHGWIAPVSLVLGYFDNSIRIYEKSNVGWSYDLGFYIAIISGFGGISLIRRKKREKY